MADNDTQGAQNGATPPAGPGTSTTTPPDQKPADGATPNDEQLGEGGLKALHAEREARKALEAEVAQLKPAADIVKQLGAIFGGEKGDKAEPEKIPEWAQELVRRNREADEREARNGLAKKVAEEHDLRDVDDIAALAMLPDEDAMRKLAPRLARTTGKPGTPRADHSAGRSGGPDSKAATVQAGRDLYDQRHGKK